MKSTKFLEYIKKIKKAEKKATSDIITNSIENETHNLIEYKVSKFILFKETLLIKDTKGIPDFLFSLFHKHEILPKNVYKLKTEDLNDLIDGIKTAEAFDIKLSKEQKIFFDIIYEIVQKDVSDIFFEYNYNQKISKIKFREIGEISVYQYISSDLMKKILPAVFNMSYGNDTTYAVFEYQSASIQESDMPRKLTELISGIRLQFNPIHPPPSRELVCRIMQKNTKLHDLSLQSLGFHEKQEDALMTSPKGLTIFSGPTGSGKSTALRAILQEFVNYHDGKKAIYAIEDPVEVELKDIYQLTIANASNDKEREEKYLEAMRSLTRSDLDFAVIGEVRDLNGASYAYKLASSGHPILTTFHASEANAIPARLRALGLPDYQVFDSSIFTRLSSQRLVPLLCEKCKVDISLEDIKKNTRGDFSVVLEKFIKNKKNKTTLKSRGKGCKNCKSKGITGRTIIAEVIETCDTYFKIYKEKGAYEAKKYWLNKKNGFDIKKHALEKISDGVIDYKYVISGDILGETGWKS